MSNDIPNIIESTNFVDIIFNSMVGAVKTNVKLSWVDPLSRIRKECYKQIDSISTIKIFADDIFGGCELPKETLINISLQSIFVGGNTSGWGSYSGYIKFIDTEPSLVAEFDVGWLSEEGFEPFEDE